MGFGHACSSIRHDRFAPPAGAGVAEAAYMAQLAETAGFLLGNAHRCGVPTDRVERAGKMIHRLIVAAS